MGFFFTQFVFVSRLPAGSAETSEDADDPAPCGDPEVGSALILLHPRACSSGRKDRSAVEMKTRLCESFVALP